MIEDELKRQYRISDQMLSMYSVLRDRHSRTALSLTLGIFGSSVLLCACTFLPDDALGTLGITPMGTKILLGAFSSHVLFLSIVELRVDWKEQSRGYADTAEALARWKAHYRNTVAISNPLTTDQMKELLASYGGTMEHRPRIPDSQFHALKARHLRKIEISKMIDSYPGCPIIFLKLRLLWRGLFKKGKQ